MIDIVFYLICAGDTILYSRKHWLSLNLVVWPHFSGYMHGKNNNNNCCLHDGGQLTSSNN